MPHVTLATLLRAANEAVETISADTAQTLLGAPDVIFVDVREGNELNRDGIIPGALHAPRGLIEFYADPASPMHNAALGSDKKVVVYCASGGRSALAGKTLQDMGVEPVLNLAGGFGAWRDAGGAVSRHDP